MEATKKLTKKKLKELIRKQFGFADLKRRIMAEIGVPYDWNYVLPEYIQEMMKDQFWRKRA